MISPNLIFTIFVYDFAEHGVSQKTINSIIAVITNFSTSHRSFFPPLLPLPSNPLSSPALYQSSQIVYQVLETL